MYGPLLILAFFFVEGERGDQKKLSKAAPGMAKVSLARTGSKSDHHEKKLRVSCPVLLSG